MKLWGETCFWKIWSSHLVVAKVLKVLPGLEASVIVASTPTSCWMHIPAKNPEHTGSGWDTVAINLWIYESTIWRLLNWSFYWVCGHYAVSRPKPEASQQMLRNMQASQPPPPQHPPKLQPEKEVRKGREDSGRSRGSFRILWKGRP